MATERLIWGEHEYKLPSMPSDEKKILFHDRKKEDQFFRRPLIPLDHEFSSWTTEQQYKFVERERQRQEEGLWFFNNGVPTYITGTHYDHLVYASFDYTPRYLDSQRHDFYFRDHLWKDKKNYGGLVIKPRRYGYTDMEVTDTIHVAQSGFNMKCGLMSDTRDKVYETLYDKITASFIKRPLYTRAKIFMRNGMIPRKTMRFESGQVSKSKGKNNLSFEQDLVLGSKITPKSTTVMGFDGGKLHKLTADEIWKWTKVSPIDFWEKQKKVLFDGGMTIGRAMLLSTMGDDDDYEDAIVAGIKMWHDSNPFDLDLNGFTKTGLLRYFVPGWLALHHPEAGHLSKYGFVNEDSATAYIMGERSKFEVGSLAHTFEMRRYPLTIDEALGSALVTGVFDRERVQGRITIINNSEKKPYVQGKLTEDNNGKVHFEKDNNEPWLIHTLPYISKENNIDKSNRWRKYDNKYVAPKNPEGAIGYDPVRYLKTDTKSGVISAACILAKYKFDYFRTGRENAAGKFAGMYLDRPDDAEYAHYEVLKAAKFWGFKVKHERQVESFIKLVRHPGVQMLDFMLDHPNDGLPGHWTDEKTWINGVNKIRTEWKTPKAGSNERDFLMEEPFVPMLEQGRDFNPKYKWKYDAIAARLMLNLGLEQIYYQEPSDDEFAYGGAQWNAMMNDLFPVRT